MFPTLWDRGCNIEVIVASRTKKRVVIIHTHQTCPHFFYVLNCTNRIPSLVLCCTYYTEKHCVHTLKKTLWRGKEGFQRFSFDTKVQPFLFFKSDFNHVFLISSGEEQILLLHSFRQSHAMIFCAWDSCLRASPRWTNVLMYFFTPSDDITKMAADWVNKILDFGFSLAIFIHTCNK